ncbi:MAG: DNA polymerase I [Candidatus Moraniibacteriota bacterium]
MTKNTPEQPILVLLDGNALVHRAYHALPPLTTATGETVQAVYGFALTLLSVIERFHPEYIAASFDLPKPTFRHKEYAEYKATRAKAPDDLYAQFPRVKELVQAFNIPIYELEGFEADDCVGTLARQATEVDPNLRVIIVTGDNDALQLVTDQVNVFTLRKGVKDTVLFDTEAVRAKYGLDPEQLKDYKGLRGDASDNIPGVKGIGEKGATDLLQKYHTLEGVYAALNEITGAIHDKLEAGRESALLSKHLGTIEVNAPITLQLEDCKTREYDIERVKQLFRDLSFFSLIKKLPGSSEQSVAGNQQATKKAKTKMRVLKTLNEVEVFFNECRKQKNPVTVVLDVEIENLFGQAMRGMSVSLRAKRGNLREGRIDNEIATISAEERIPRNDSSAYIAFTPETETVMKNFFEDEMIQKIVYDAKSMMKLLAAKNITLNGVTGDTMIAGYLLDAGSKITLEKLLAEEGLEMLETKTHEASVVEMARQIGALHTKQQVKLETNAGEQQTPKHITELLQEMELPLVAILFRMEQAGIQLDSAILQKLSAEMTDELRELEKQVFALAGRDFNLNSPKQLAQILFEDLHIPTRGVKKLKTGFSTASPELAKLRDEYPIITLIEEYRERFKLKSTYLDVLPRLADSEGRIHTTFQQTIAATGRLSSSDPNLQNIPARGQWSERIRSAFVAGEGKVLVGADYSQIELRVAAHLADDEVMIEAFRNHEDIHTTTAMTVYGVAKESVTSEMRSQAKVFNFGILYGMGTYGMSQAAGIEQQQASEFIQNYLQKFAGIARYIETLKQSARENGFVETELGRRRSVPEINSPNIMLARSGERMAVNMPIQGLEADIVKLAMIAVDKLIAEQFATTATMLLQVHDELIFEVDETQAEIFMQAVKQSMESVYALKVPLIVEVYQGKNWGEI